MATQVRKHVSINSSLLTTTGVITEIFIGPLKILTDSCTDRKVHYCPGSNLQYCLRPKMQTPLRLRDHLWLVLTWLWNHQGCQFSGLSARSSRF